jgi:hypothetical protein
MRYARILPAILVAACAKSEPPPPPPAPPGPPAVVQVIATEYAFQMPDTLTAGATTFHLVDNGAEVHHIQIARLEQGKTVADLQELKPGTPPPAWFVEIGGPNTPRPGGGESWGTVDLTPGNYVALCFIPSPAPDNRPHFVKGMVHPFVVVPTEEKREAPAPHFTLTLNDFSFNFSNPLPAGTHDIRVVNAGPQAHEVLFVRLDPGKKAGDLLTWFGAGMKGPPPGEPIGGTTGIAPNGENIIKVNLTPGEYALYCFLDDVTDHKMHFEHGMVSQFTVQ